MKIIIAALFCSFISAICASDFNSSLLESKVNDASTSSSSTFSGSSSSKFIIWTSHVITIYKKPKVDSLIEIFVSATLVSPQTLLTGMQYASTIEAKLIHPNKTHPQYGACIQDTNTNTVIDVIPIIATIYYDIRTFRVAPKFQKLALLRMEKPLETVTLQDIKKVVNVNYIYDKNMKVFTYGNYQGIDISKLGTIQRIEFEERCGGFAAPLGQDKDYHIFPGAPLIHNNIVVGICDGWVFNENDRREEHEREKIYKFILLYSL